MFFSRNPISKQIYQYQTHTNNKKSATPQELHRKTLSQKSLSILPTTGMITSKHSSKTPTNCTQTMKSTVAQTMKNTIDGLGLDEL